MAWSTRRNSRSYRRSRRVGKQVLTDCLGSGPEAELSARLDELRREQRRANQTLWLLLLSSLEQSDRLLDELNLLNQLLAASLLLLSGWHVHNTEWRRRCVYRNRRARD
jgi:hypothetical protein